METRGEGDRVSGESRPTVVRRFLDARHDLIVATGDFGPLFAEYLDHVRRWESEPDGLSKTLMRQGLAASALHLSCRPLGEYTAWTIHIPRPPVNVFLAGNSADAVVAGRVFTENIEVREAGRLYVQSRRADGDLVESSLDVVGFDVLEFFEAYYRRSEQAPARFLEITEEEFVLLFGLPDVDEEWLEDLGREEAIGIAEDEHRLLDARVFRFRCGCEPQVMREVVQ
jgi:hypothetical protein